MIKANELRIGNWIEAVAPMGNYYMKMYSVNFESLENHPDSANPIPLTPEILEKCGFTLKKLGYNDCYRKPFKTATFLLYAHSGRYYFTCFEVNHETEIKCLHQLQNLYYALTGEELNIPL
jgi:hypothetical protein